MLTLAWFWKLYKSGFWILGLESFHKFFQIWKICKLWKYALRVIFFQIFNTDWFSVILRGLWRFEYFKFQICKVFKNCVRVSTCLTQSASCFSVFWKLWKVAWHLFNEKLRYCLDPRKNWNCKSWENARYSISWKPLWPVLGNSVPKRGHEFLLLWLHFYSFSKNSCFQGSKHCGSCTKC